MTVCPQVGLLGDSVWLQMGTDARSYRVWGLRQPGSHSKWWLRVRPMSPLSAHPPAQHTCVTAVLTEPLPPCKARNHKLLPPSPGLRGRARGSLSPTAWLPGGGCSRDLTPSVLGLGLCCQAHPLPLLGSAQQEIGERG